ncbi:MAG: class I SAM-dependent methyltransferase [Mangrovicoccus sp.]|nr:class I SAM-dependent methyltransferase [Mangrovicoccus sp.]
MFEDLEKIHTKPGVFEVYTAQSLWAEAHRAQQMLQFHLDGQIDVSSRNHVFLDRSSAWITKQFDLGPGKTVCDFGCGPGLYTARLAASGARVSGIDFSHSSITYARAQAAKAGLPISYHEGNYLEFIPQQRFDLITMIMCDYCALSPEQRQKLLGIWRDCLGDDGAILLDVYSMAAFARREETSFCEKNQLGHFWYAEDYYAFVNSFKYESEAVMLDKYSLFPARGKPETVYNWLQYFSLESLSAELAQAGLQIDQSFRDVAGQPFSPEHDEFAVIIKKLA